MIKHSSCRVYKQMIIFTTIDVLTMKSKITVLQTATMVHLTTIFTLHRVRVLKIGDW